MQNDPNFDPPSYLKISTNTTPKAPNKFQTSQETTNPFGVLILNRSPVIIQI